MIPDFPMPPGLHGIFDSDDGSGIGSLNKTKQQQDRMYHSFVTFSIPDDEFDDRGFNDPLPYSPIIKQVRGINFDLQISISSEHPQSPTTPDTPPCPGPLKQIFSNPLIWFPQIQSFD